MVGPHSVELDVFELRSAALCGSHSIKGYRRRFRGWEGRYRGRSASKRRQICNYQKK
ncbi:hypothetical protein MPC4_10400 [Methylocella tundrae]|uniref:Uncharacterized protein n=1 Tax=Methylocella tundrae TaxID=227605 RepID=A0A8B6M156_METTU|nr:hypothetical protein MPC4_10400 [Methylocella tundrae]